ncbi:MAG: hypothetical protein ACQUHE_03325, partial [Bacteroidia bacterium]
MRYFNKTVVCLMLSVYCQHALGQNSYLSSEKPKQGEKITINYHNSPGAKLVGMDTVFTGIQYWDENGAYFKRTIALTQTNSESWSTVFEVPKDAAYLKIRFYQLSSDYAEASINKMVYSKGLPVRGGTYQDFSGAKLHDKFHEEIERYPTNYFAYARYISSLPSDTVDAIVPVLIAKLRLVKVVDDGLLTALTVAYAKQGKREMAYDLLLQLLEKYPSSTCTDFAFSHFLYEQYRTGGSMLATGILYEKLRDIFIRFPESGIASTYNNITILSADKSI